MCINTGVAVKFKLPRVGSCTTNIAPNVTADKLAAFYSEDWKEDSGVIRCKTATGDVSVSTSFVQSPREETSDAYEVVVNIGEV